MASILPAGVRNGMKGMDANRYATKKTVAQGMLDIALLTSNASQLKYVLQVGHKHEFYTLLVTLISISIFLQVMMGLVLLSLNLFRDCRLHLPHYNESANCINYMTTAGAFVVTVLIVGLLFVAIGGLNLNEHGDQPSALILNDVIILGALIGVVLGYVFNINHEPDQRKAELLNNITLGFTITVMGVNALLSIFYSMHVDMQVSKLE